ncbi:hypothetical protein SteCoe_9052 [Stentor coeruleus]|uniref:Uncharacterized protein n=1 Tax=Stentor coeruleus TaxID=5963 RepID=A0A1R2CIW9_9CILI|nr:hypothetical protein SteCoe_9052 [Stentor coeruleus]
MPVRVKSPSPIKNRKNSQSILQDLDKEIESLLEEVGKNYPIGEIPEICGDNTKTVEEKKRKNERMEIGYNRDEKDEGVDRCLVKEIGYVKDEVEEKLERKLEKSMKMCRDDKSFEGKTGDEVGGKGGSHEEMKDQVLVKENAGEEMREQDLERRGEIRGQEKSPGFLRRNANSERKNQDKSPFASKKPPSKSPIRSSVIHKNEEKWISPRKQAERIKYQSIDITLDPQNTRHSQNTEENSSDIEKTSRKPQIVIKPSKKQNICSEIDALLAEKPRASPMIIPGKAKIAPSPIKKSVSPMPSFKKHNSIDDIKVRNKPFEESKEKHKKNDKVYEKLTKIANKPRPDVVDGKDQDKKLKAEDFDNHLWEDAQRRASVHNIPDEENTDIVAGLTSQRMLARKFMKEFKENLLKKNEVPESFEFEGMFKVLKDMNFVGETEDATLDNEGHIGVKFWKFIKNNEKLDKERLVSALLSVLSLHPSQLFQDYSKEDTDFYNFHIILQSFLLEEEIKLAKLFTHMKETRKGQNQPVKDTQVEEFSFKPHVNNDLETLGKKKREEIGRPMSQKRLDFFMKERQKIQEKSEKSKINKEEEELKKCTFRPKTLKKTDSKTGLVNEHRGLTLYEKSKVIKDVNIKSSLEIELEKSLAECTFAPKLITKKKIKEEPSGLYSKSVQQQITRMQKAREEEARKKAILEGINPNKVTNTTDIEGELRPKSPGKNIISRPESKTPDKFMPQINLTDFDNALTDRLEDYDNSKV